MNTRLFCFRLILYQINSVDASVFFSKCVDSHTSPLLPDVRITQCPLPEICLLSLCGPLRTTWMASKFFTPRHANVLIICHVGSALIQRTSSHRATPLPAAVNRSKEGKPPYASPKERRASTHPVVTIFILSGLCQPISDDVSMAEE